MSKKKLLGLIFLLTLLSCSKPKTEFEKTFEKLDQLKLPITFNSNRDFDTKGITRDSIGIKAVPYGRLFQSDKILTSIVLSVPVYQIVPHIYTYDKEGNFVEGFNCFKGPGKGPGWSIIENCTILPDKTIVFVDSTVTSEFTTDSLGMTITPGTSKLKVTTEKYKILDTGKIQKIE